MRIVLRHEKSPFTVELQKLDRSYRAVVGDIEHEVETRPLGPATTLLVVDGWAFRVHVVRSGSQRLVAVGGEVYAFVPDSGAAEGRPTTAAVATPEIKAPMPGKVLQVLVRQGDRVDPGDGLLILEAMKMENRLVAEAAGTVAEVRVREGDTVDGGQVLLVLRYD